MILEKIFSVQKLPSVSTRNYSFFASLKSLTTVTHYAARIHHRNFVTVVTRSSAQFLNDDSHSTTARQNRTQRKPTGLPTLQVSFIEKTSQYNDESSTAFNYMDIFKNKLCNQVLNSRHSCNCVQIYNFSAGNPVNQRRWLSTSRAQFSDTNLTSKDPKLKKYIERLKLKYERVKEISPSDEYKLRPVMELLTQVIIIRNYITATRCTKLPLVPFRWMRSNIPGWVGQSVLCVDR